MNGLEGQEGGKKNGRPSPSLGTGGLHWSHLALVPSIMLARSCELHDAQMGTLPLVAADGQVTRSGGV